LCETHPNNTEHPLPFLSLVSFSQAEIIGCIRVLDDCNDVQDHYISPKESRYTTTNNLHTLEKTSIS
jgi:hypothetical protein